MPYPRKDWTFDQFLDTCRRLTDPDNTKWAVELGQNRFYLVFGTHVLAFGGKILNEAKDRAIYGDDPNALRGAEFNVDLHTRHKVTFPLDMATTLPQGKLSFEQEMVAMTFNGGHLHERFRQAIGAQNLDYVPPPKGPTGIQTAAAGSNAFSIMALSKAREAAWAGLKWLHSKEGINTPHLQAVSWPPTIEGANSPQWMNLFQGTRIADVQEVWQKNGHDLVVVPEGGKAWSTMDGPIIQALKGEMGTRDALRESARLLNELFAQRPANWR